MITVTGVVKDFQWVNPHTWLHIVVDDPKDGKVEWAAEVARPASFFVPAGRRRRSKRVRRSPLNEPREGRIADLDHRARDQGGRDHPVESTSLR